MTQTTNIHAHGVLQSQSQDLEGKHVIIMTVPETSYELHLETIKPLETEPGKRLAGTIRVNARRVDQVETGGRYIEPVYGRPRRVQGRVLAIHAESNAITVNAGVPIELKLNKLQKANDFQEGDFVSCDVLPGATFTSQM
ncbi:MAG: hypothetical protein AAGB34_09440 [Planctomycetota bacterium]